MNLEGILLYSVRALRFAACIELIWQLIYYWRWRRWGLAQRQEQRRYFWLRCVFAFYVAALLQITVIRGGISLDTLQAAAHDGSTIQLVPLVYTLQQAQAGWWAIVYPVCGNLLWFAPLGYLLPQIVPGRWQSWQCSVMCGLLLSCSVEGLQWLFGSGVSDIDDVLFNVLGALLGYVVFSILPKQQKER